MHKIVLDNAGAVQITGTDISSYCSYAEYVDLKKFKRVGIRFLAEKVHRFS